MIKKNATTLAAVLRRIERRETGHRLKAERIRLSEAEMGAAPEGRGRPGNGDHRLEQLAQWQQPVDGPPTQDSLTPEMFPVPR